MQQNGTSHRTEGLAVILLAILPLWVACETSTCRELSGRWTNREGQSFYFEPGEKALWLVRFGSHVDTFEITYRYDCKKQPAELDLSGFRTGPLGGKSLYGILEWSSDTSFRFDAESGTEPGVRPREFGTDQTQKFFREN